MKWEHKTVPQQQANTLGEEGWELVAVTGGQPYIESSRTIPQGAQTVTQNVVRYAPIQYHMKRRK